MAYDQTYKMKMNRDQLEARMSTLRIALENVRSQLITVRIALGCMVDLFDGTPLDDIGRTVKQHERLIGLASRVEDIEDDVTAILSQAEIKTQDLLARED